MDTGEGGRERRGGTGADVDGRGKNEEVEKARVDRGRQQSDKMKGFSTVGRTGN